MSRILILYGTSEGHTALIAERIAEAIRGEGHDAFPVDVASREAPPLESYDGVIVGASVHQGSHQAAMRRFVRTHHAALERRPSAFFSVSLAAAEASPKAHREAEGYVERFAQATGWRPVHVGLFAGALAYTKYGFFVRWVMKRIARSKGSADLDTTRDYVYTDWDAVARFATDFLARSFPATCAVNPKG